jgi:hypothetical protein
MYNCDMCSWWDRILGNRRSVSGAINLPAIDLEAVRGMLVRREGLSHVDWSLADAWLQRHHPDDPLMRRAIAAAWLELLREELAGDYQAWRTLRYDALTPFDGTLGQRIRSAADRSLDELTRSLKPIRGEEPIPAFVMVGVSSREDYSSFLSPMFSDGQQATSGGIYAREHDGQPPMLVLNLVNRGESDSTIAHELTHHALADAGIPLWIEEGLTQMMEERVTHTANFLVNAEAISKMRSRWSGERAFEFLDGRGYGSPDDDDQQLAYLLSQWIVRRCLEERPKPFFAFLRACRETEPDDACVKHMGCTTEELARDMAGLEGA